MGALQPAFKPAVPGTVKAKILVLNGDNDDFTTKEQIASFKQEMQNAGADYQFISYPHAKHSFTNPDADSYAKEFKMSVGYNADADRQSWEELKIFLHRIFK